MNALKHLIKMGVFILLFFLVQSLAAQELFVHSEPASNMPKDATGFRSSNKIMNMGERMYPYNKQSGYSDQFIAFRTSEEVMYGFTKSLMAHIGVSFSNMQNNQKFDFDGIYGYVKYRFLSNDKDKSHFRMAAMGQISLNDSKYNMGEIDLVGSNSGLMGGIVATKLYKKLAINFTTAYYYSFPALTPFHPNLDKELMLSLGFGYLCYPLTYNSFKQTNVNLYLEFLFRNQYNQVQNPKEDLFNSESFFLDIAPSIQFIINSKIRIDVSTRQKLIDRFHQGRFQRAEANMYLLKLEYNIFNSLRK